MRKAKIVDTIGPATESLEGITSLVEAGMDVARLNRSHGTPEDHLKVYNNLRAAAKATGRNVAALVDLQGPKIRCGWFKKNADGEDKVQLTEGQEFVITTDDIEGDEHITSTTFKGLPGDCHAGDPILIDDGKVRLEVTKVEGNNVYTKVVVAGPVSSHKGINLPGVAVSLPALTEKDEEDLRWAIRTGADIIAMSFVRFATDIDRAHEIMDEEGRRIPVVAKIEKPQALENLEEIVKAFDGIMVARGDMAVECPLEEVPLATKRCIELARQYAKPVIVATEVLGSMVSSPVPDPCRGIRLRQRRPRRCRRHHDLQRDRRRQVPGSHREHHEPHLHLRHRAWFRPHPGAEEPGYVLHRCRLFRRRRPGRQAQRQGHRRLHPDRFHRAPRVP